MGPDRFEELCAEILEKNRFGRVEMLGCMRAGSGKERWRAAAAAARIPGVDGRVPGVL